MKKTKTLESFFSRVSIGRAPHDAPAPVPAAAPAEAQAQVGEQEVAAAPAQALPTAEQETITTRASAVVVELSQPALGQETTVNEANVEEEGEFDHILDPDDIIADPGLRKPIEEFHPNVRDDAKREYVLLGPCQPKGHAYPKRKIYNRNRSFHDSWYKNRPWLEYSIAKDAAFCFYCYLFPPLRVDNFGVEAFTNKGFTSWKDGPKLLDDHADSILHNKARVDYKSFKNQRQSVDHAMSSGTKKGDEKYKGRLIIILGVVRFLLLQAHAFRGHDESSKSRNKGNFVEMIEWYKDKDKKAARLLNTAAKNNTMTSHKIQKDMCKACGEQTARAIVADIGDRNFAVLVDESRDASIKEQMAVILRYVNVQGQVIERFLGLKCVADTTSSSLKEALDGDTRWGSHHKTLCRLQHMWAAVLEVLENIAEDATIGEKRTTASGLLVQMENFEFVLILHLMINLLGITNDLSQCLQRKDQNIIRAIGLIGITLQKINDVRQHGWEELLEEVQEFCETYHIVIPNMEDKLTVRGRSRGRGGQQVTYYHHFKNEIFNVVHDQVIAELNNRFAERSTELLRCIACLDPKNSFANYDREKLIQLAEIYSADFSHYERNLLRRQLDNFIADVRADPGFTSCIDLGILAVKLVQTDRHETFPLVYRLIELALILPVATATVERAFSAMKIIKTESRNKMGDEWLNHRMICYIERDVFASIKNEDILQHFQELKSRRKKLPKIGLPDLDIDDEAEEG